MFATDISNRSRIPESVTEILRFIKMLGVLLAIEKKVFLCLHSEILCIYFKLKLSSTEKYLENVSVYLVLRCFLKN